jgi:hypothetical protein
MSFLHLTSLYFKNKILTALGLSTIKTVQGLPIASVKTINGVPIASIKSIQGWT